MMRPWHILLNVYCLSIIIGRAVDASIFQSVFGLPKDCVHQNVVQSCQLSFSCWLQGGHYAEGCGNNKWLFSCCIQNKKKKKESSAVLIGINTADGVASAPAGEIVPPTSYSRNKHVIKANYLYKNEIDLPMRMPTTSPPLSAYIPKYRYRKYYQVKQNMLRRRIDDEPFLEECGIPRTAENTIQKRIIGGRVAHFAEYPWQAHIRVAEYQCGGVLVSRSFIITAAHCIEQAPIKDIVIYLGELDTQNSGTISEPFPAEKHRAIRKVIHPRFQFRITQPDRYDLALLQMAIPTSYQNHIQPICLPTKPIKLTGRRGLIAGWGKIDISMGHTGTAILQTATVPIISTYECINWHERKNINVELFDEMFCAGYSDGHQDACLGDSGGPLILMENGRFTLIGITSAGFGCGVDHQPGIYHNVQKTTRWIQHVINRLEMNRI